MASLTRSSQTLERLSGSYDDDVLKRYRPSPQFDCSHAVDLTEIDRSEKLRQTIEAEIIPRLMLLHGPVTPAESDAPTNDNTRVCLDVEEFAEVVLDLDLKFAQHYIELLLEQGVTLDRVFLGLMAPVAQRLGDLWLSDERSFAEVTIGLGLLQQLLRIYSSAFQAESGGEIESCRMILSPTRAEQHTFGLCVLDLYLRRAGCDVELCSRFELPAMSRMVKGEWIDVIGLSAGCDVLIDELSSDIKDLRRVSFNGSLRIIVGGPAFIGQPERVAKVGADGFAEDAPQAVRLIRGMMRRAAGG
jgi:methanogenic corrinoid protein MtbC1